MSFLIFFSRRKCIAYMQLMRFDKPIGTLLLLYPTLWALFIANDGIPSISILAIFILGVIVMRSAGCVINDYADRHFDGNVKRTSSRPLVSGKVTVNEAKWLFVFLIAMAFVLVLQLNLYTIKLSIIALILAMIYPFMKRYTHLPQLVLGMAFGWAIPMAFGAIVESLPFECWLLFGANLAWTIAYDTQYAMVDRDDDLKIGVKSTAILFAQYDIKIIALLQIICLFLLVFLGQIKHFSLGYFVCLGIAGILFIYQYHLIKMRGREDCFKAFLNNHYVGLSILMAIIIARL